MSEQFIPIDVFAGEDQALMAECFLDLITDAIDNDNQQTVGQTIQELVAGVEIDFVEPTFEDDEFTPLADRMEHEVSTFIEENTPTSSFEAMGTLEHAQIGAIYNPQNLLFFAKDLITRSGSDFSQKELDMIYRYRTILKRLDEQAEVFLSAYNQSQLVEDSRRKTGARAWAGRVRPYGFRDDGKIDPVDYNDFDAEKEDISPTQVIVDGVQIRLGKIHGRIIQ